MKNREETHKDVHNHVMRFPKTSLSLVADLRVMQINGFCNLQIPNEVKLGVVVHTFISSTQETEACGPLSSRST